MKVNPNRFDNWLAGSLKSAIVIRQSLIFIALTFTIVGTYIGVKQIFGVQKQSEESTEVAAENRTAGTELLDFCIGEGVGASMPPYSSDALRHCRTRENANASHTDTAIEEIYSAGPVNSSGNVSTNDTELSLKRLNDVFSLPVNKIDPDDIERHLLDLIANSPELAVNLFGYPWHVLDDPEGLFLRLTERLNETNLALVSDAALHALNSSNNLERMTAIAFLNISNQVVDPNVRSRLIDIGWADQDQFVQLAIADALSTASESGYSRDAQIMLLSEIANSGSSYDAQATALFSLVELGFEGPEFEAIALPLLLADQSEIRNAAVSAIGATRASQTARSALFTLADSAQNDPSVRAHVISVLQSFDLTASEGDRLNTLMGLADGEKPG